MNRPQPPTDPHASHDRLLVAAYVAGDLEGPDLDRARDLVDGCDECATLAGDLTGLTAAIRALPVPRRPRDFRIGAEQAAALDRRGLRRLLGSRRPALAFARPLGTAFAALGVAGLLFTSVLGGQLALLPSSGGTSALAPGYAATFEPEAAGSERTDTASRSGASAPVMAASPGQVVAPSPAAGPSAAASAAASDQGAAGGSGATPPPVATPSSKTAVLPPSIPTGTPAPGSPASPPVVPGTGGFPLVPAASLVALLAGLGLLGADLVVRRR